MKECKKCNATFEDKHDFCPHCGQKLTPKVEKRRNSNKLAEILSDKENPNPKLRPLTEKEAVICKYKNYLGVFLCLYISITPFYLFGFSFGFFWYLLIAFVIFLLLSLWGTAWKTREDMSTVNEVLIMLIVIGFIMFLWGPLNPNYN